MKGVQVNRGLDHLDCCFDGKVAMNFASPCQESTQITPTTISLTLWRYDTMQYSDQLCQRPPYKGEATYTDLLSFQPTIVKSSELVVL